MTSFPYLPEFYCLVSFIYALNCTWCWIVPCKGFFTAIILTHEWVFDCSFKTKAGLLSPSLWGFVAEHSWTTDLQLEVFVLIFIRMMTSIKNFELPTPYVLMILWVNLVHNPRMSDFHLRLLVFHSTKLFTTIRIHQSLSSLHGNTWSFYYQDTWRFFKHWLRVHIWSN